MARKMKDSEFGGGSGLIQKHNLDNGTLESYEEVWSIYASDPNSSDEPDARRVGDPESYVSKAPAPSGVPPVDPVTGA
jgi:hypothetical protein